MKTYRPTALALPGQKQHTFALIIHTVGTQVGAGQQTELYLPIDNERQADSVLFLSKETEGTIDRIDGPKSTGAATRIRASVNRRKDSITVRTVKPTIQLIRESLNSLFFRPCLALCPCALFRSSLGEPFIDELDDLVPQTLVLPQFRCVLFANDLVFWEGFQEV